MDLSEFEHIFGSGESAFVIWDTDNNGLIDSLELFSGITLFSDTKIEDKIRCTLFNWDISLAHSAKGLSPFERSSFKFYKLMRAWYYL